MSVIESVAIIAGDDEHDEVYIAVLRYINDQWVRFIERFKSRFFDPDTLYDAWFVDAGGGGVSGYQPAIAHVPAVDSTYKYSLISENGAIWGVPFADEDVIRLSAGDVVDIGGGIVGIDYANADGAGNICFVSGNTVDIRGTTNYNGEHTLTSGTSTTQLQFADTYVAETLDGTETVIKKLGTVNAGQGRFVVDSTQTYFYYGHNWDAGNSTYVTRITAADDTFTYNALSPNPAWPLSASGSTVYGMAIDSTDTHLYLWAKDTAGATNYGRMSKFRLSDGVELWRSSRVPGVTSFPGYDMAIDSNGNAYAPATNGAEIIKFASADGATTEISMPVGHGSAINTLAIYSVVYDGTNDKIIAGGRQSISTNFNFTDIKNMIIMDTDGGNQVTVAVGGYYQAGSLYFTPIVGTGNIQVLGNNIFVLVQVSGGTPRLFKYDFSGNLLSSIDASADAEGLFIDNYDNIVVVNNDWVSPQDTRFYWYDSNLNALGSAGPFTTLLLKSWAATAGGAWIQGSALSRGVIGQAASGQDETFYPPNTGGSYCHLEGETVNILADGIKYPQQTVINCEIDDTEFPNATELIVGLPVRYKLQPMEVNIEDYGFLLDKNITQLLVNFFRSLDGKYGPDMNNLDQIGYYRPTYDTGPTLFSGVKRLPFQGQYHDKGDLLFWGDHNLPHTILGIGVKTGATG